MVLFVNGNFLLFLRVKKMQTSDHKWARKGYITLLTITQDPLTVG